MPANPGKQCIWISSRDNRRCPESQQAGHLDIQMLLPVTGKQGICIYSRVISRPNQIPASRASVRTFAQTAPVPDTGKQCICRTMTAFLKSENGHFACLACWGNPQSPHVPFGTAAQFLHNCFWRIIKSQKIYLHHGEFCPFSWAICERHL